jgi:hypothetical protein
VAAVLLEMSSLRRGLGIEGKLLNSKKKKVCYLCYHPFPFHGRELLQNLNEISNENEGHASTPCFAPLLADV